MPRPRVWVNRDGKVVKTATGVSYNRARGRFYVIASDGKRQEFKTWDEARAALATERANSIPSAELSRIVAVARHRSNLAYERLYGDARLREILDEVTIAGPQVVSSAPYAETVVGFAEAANALADQVGVPRMKIDRDLDALATGPRLRHVIEKWEHHKVEELGGRVTSNIRDVRRHWKQFVEQVKNIHVAELSPSHFRKFHSWLAREGAKYSSTQWRHDRASNIKSVITFVKKKYPEWPWPAGVLEWADSYHFRAFKPKAANRRPMPVDVFAALISQCRTWARTDPKTIPAATQSGRGKREQARRRRRDGIQFEAILRLALNCGLDPVDIERITWNALKLDERVPHMRFPRRKIEGMTGEAIDRLTPLLPSTVDSLLRWREHEMPVGGPVFRTARKGRYGRSSVSATMKRLREEASVDDSWSFKHLRNVGPTLGKRGRRSRDERDAFLGHVVDGTSKFYEGDVDETYLIPLVNLIGEQYFGSENVS